MSRVTRYIAGQIVIVTIVATVALWLLVTLVQSIKFIELIINNGLPVSEFLRMSLLAAPRYLVYLIPVVIFGATLFTYNRMINDSELVVLRAAGFSRSRLARPGIIIALASVAIGYALNLYIMPATQSEFRQIILQARSEWGAAILKEGQFTTIGNKATIYIKERTSAGELLNIFYYNVEDDLTIIAKRGAIIDTDDGPRVLAVEGNKQYYRNGKLHVLKFERSTLDIGMSKKVSGYRWVEPQERFVQDLFYPNMDNPNDRHNYDKLRAAGHARVVAPALPLTLALVALAVIMSGQFSRRGQLKQVLFAIGLMIAIYVGHIWTSNVAARTPSATFTIYLNTLVPLLVAGVVIFKPVRALRGPAAQRQEAA